MSTTDPTAETLPTPLNPYRFTVDIAPSGLSGEAWQIGLWIGNEDVWWSDTFVDADDVEDHASLILSALHQATREDT